MVDKHDVGWAAAGWAARIVGTGALIKAIAIATIVALVGLVVFGIIMAASVGSAAADCSPPGGGGGGGGGGAGGDPSDRTFDDEQVENAQAIDKAASSGGLGGQAVQLGLMAALVESDLINIDYGDSVGPDSRGIFQQRAQGWGPEDKRMDPYSAATAFFGVDEGNYATAPGLVDIDGWEDMEPTAAIHAVQKNGDPGIYADKVGDALAVAKQANIDLNRSGDGPPDGNAPKPQNVSAEADSESLVWPVGKDAPQTSPYGWRTHPVSGKKKFHSGQDFGVPSGTPVHAMAGGTVTFSGEQSGYGFVVIIKHNIDGKVIGTAYAHNSKLEAIVGDTVMPGDVIAQSGGDKGDPGAGTSTGAHVHFEVRPGNKGTGEANTTDPIKFLKTGKAVDAPDDGGDGGDDGAGGGGGSDDKCGTGGGDGDTPGGPVDGSPEPPKKGPDGNWPGETCSETDPSQPKSKKACVTPRMALVYQLAESDSLGHDGGSCWDPHEQNPKSDHPKGKACDFLFGTYGKFPEGDTKKRGWALANYLKENADTWGINYVIWQGKIWSTAKADQGWRPYSGGGAYDPTNPTGGHYDHVHASVF